MSNAIEKTTISKESSIKKKALKILTRCIHYLSKFAVIALAAIGVSYLLSIWLVIPFGAAMVATILGALCTLMITLGT